MYYGCGCNQPQVIVHPTQCCVKHYYQTQEVVHVHPVQYQHVNHMVYKHVHEYPVCHSSTGQVYHQSVDCGPPPCC
ncbi:CotD family spore coat protein [Fictibacillus macauensis]|uniref:CotD family spore coat protein n=1 Tax=Fictibacillus macauensis TaxID=245160 RepID=UPI001389DABB|nr:CotD family spore coat protein [Fictibacillus macauensis]